LKFALHLSNFVVVVVVTTVIAIIEALLIDGLHIVWKKFGGIDE
jgi:hypothetical protein